MAGYSKDRVDKLIAKHDKIAKEHDADAKLIHEPDERAESEKLAKKHHGKAANFRALKKHHTD